MEGVIEHLLHALAQGRPAKMLDFGGYQLLKKLGGGQQGVVVKARNPSGKHFAIKLYAPTDTSPQLLKRGRDRFVRETSILLDLTHHNIANIHLAGSARWDSKQWQVGTRFNHRVLYYVMDHIQGRDVKTLFYKRRKHYEIDEQKRTREGQRRFEELIVQVGNAMQFYHTKKVTHLDIKPENIIYSAHDNTFVIVDFGFARAAEPTPAASSSEYLVKRRYADYESEQVGLLDAHCDQYMFGKMLTEVFDLFVPLYPEKDGRGIRSVLGRATADRTARYRNMGAFVEAIEPYLHARPPHRPSFALAGFLAPRLGFGHLDSTVRIPFTGSIPLCKDVRAIIDTKDFQRLRGVFQLGPTHYVYPGATHTRFEHSLGTYGLCLKYLNTLLADPAFREAIAPAEEGIKVAILVSLLHDLGHFPYSHWIEELKPAMVALKLGRHEDRAAEIIQNGEIGRLIRYQWGVSPAKVCRVIRSTGTSQQERMLSSLVDSVIDLDKMDYLQRDSAHCGVPYGEGFDVQRLISSLCVNEEGTAICLTEKGRSCFAAFLMSKIVMYQEVYWHKTVRACTAMFKRFVYELIHSKVQRPSRIARSLWGTDAEFIKSLYAKSKSVRSVHDLIRPFTNAPRSLYKPAWVHYHSHRVHLQDNLTTEFFEMLKSCTYEGAVDLTRHLVDDLKSSLPGLRATDIILETTPVRAAEKSNLRGFKFLDTSLGRYEYVTEEIEGLNSYLDTNRRSYLFCRPNFYKQLRALASNGALRKALGRVVDRMRAGSYAIVPDI